MPRPKRSKRAQVDQKPPLKELRIVLRDIYAGERPPDSPTIRIKQEVDDLSDYGQSSQPPDDEDDGDLTYQDDKGDKNYHPTGSVGVTGARKRGRPRKIKPTVGEPKRRGRPPGSKNLKKKTTVVKKQAWTRKVRVKQEEFVEEPVVKRRDRKKKQLAGYTVVLRDGTEIPIPAQRRLCLVRQECFICFALDGLVVDCGTDRQLSDHVKEAHMVPKGLDSVELPCMLCNRSFLLKEPRTRWCDVSEILISLVNHLVTSHSKVYKLPNYICPLYCPVKGCDHTAYCLNFLKFHVKRIHFIDIINWESLSHTFPAIFCADEDAKIDIQDFPLMHPGLVESQSTPAEEKTQLVGSLPELIIPGQRKLRLTRMECFLCSHLHRKTPWMRNCEAMAQHVRQEHLDLVGHRRYSLQCLYCKKSYTFDRQHTNWGALCDAFSGYIPHLLNCHPDKFVLPSYVRIIRCPMKSCQYVAYTIMVMRKHLRSKHNCIITNVAQARDFFPWLTASGAVALDTTEPGEDDSEDSRSELIPSDQGTEITIPGQRRMRMTRYECVICYQTMEQAPVFSTEQGLTSHIKGTHIQEVDHESTVKYALKCLHCDKTWSFDSEHLRWGSFCDAFISYLPHLMHVHPEAFKKPDFIMSLTCPAKSCTWETYSIASMRRHLKSRHDLIISTWQQAHKVFPWLATPNRMEDTDSRASSDLESPSDPLMMEDWTCIEEVKIPGEKRMFMSRYECFICERLQSEKVILGSEREFADHIKQTHIVNDHRDHYKLKCMMCDKSYSFQQPFMRWALVLESLANYMGHLLQNHGSHFEKPEYVWAESCPDLSCDFVGVTIFQMKQHLKTKHKMVGLDLKTTVAFLPKVVELLHSVEGTSEEDSMTAPESNQADDDVDMEDVSTDRIAKQEDSASRSSDEDKEKEAPDELPSSMSRLHMSQQQCFICYAKSNAEVTFDSFLDLGAHIKDHHVVQESADFCILPCLYCQHCFTFRSGRDRGSICNTAASLFLHLLEAHPERFEKPDFVKSIACPIEGCSFKAFVLRHVRIHLKNVHNLSVNDKSSLLSLLPCSEQKPTPSLKAKLLMIEQSLVDQKLLLTEHRCFVCHALNPGEVPDAYDGEAELAEHMKDAHFTMDDSDFVLTCTFCPAKFTFSEDQMDWPSLSKKLILILKHLLKNHSDQFSLPNFVEVFKCPLKDCGHSFFTLTAFKTHMQVIHETVLTGSHWDSSMPARFSGMAQKRKSMRDSDASPSKMKRLEGEISSGPTSEIVNTIIGYRKLVMTKYECFICSSQNKEAYDFGIEYLLASHIKDTHIDAGSSSSVLRCIYCEVEYYLNDKLLNCGLICETLVRYVSHLMSCHSDKFVLPSYIKTFPCPQPCCNRVLYSLHFVKMHLKEDHGVNLTYDRALVIYPHLKNMEIAETQPQGVSTSWHKRGPAHFDIGGWYANDSDTRVHLEEPVENYPMFSEKCDDVSEAMPPELLLLHDYQLISTEFECFLCPGIQYESQEELRTHWVDFHWMKEKGEALFTCTFCSVKYTCRVVKLTPTFASEVMAVYCQHLTDAHSMSHSIPDGVLRAACLLHKCDQHFFSLMTLRKHMKSHGVYVENEIALKRGACRIPIEKGVSKMLIQYRCFICNDEVDHLSILAFINHWLDKHFKFQASTCSVRCADCDHLSTIEISEGNLKVGPLMTLIGTHLAHAMKVHGAKPDCVTRVKSVPGGQSKAGPGVPSCLDPDHKALSVLSRFPGKPQALKQKVDYTSYRCFLCADSTVFADEEELLTHWFSEHVSETTQKASVVRCPFCTQTWQVADKSELQASQVFLCYHFNKAHRDFVIPDYVVRHTCPLLNCGEESFSTASENIHMKSHNFKLSRNVFSSGAWTFPIASNHIVYDQYCCFVCKDKKDHNSLIEFINHWLVSHLIAVKNTVYALHCPHCDQTYHLACKNVRWVKNLFAVMGSLLQHFIAFHNYACPSYVLHLPASSELRTPAKPLARIELVSMYQDIHEAQAAMTSFRCFHCEGKPKVFETQNEFFDHWLDEHMNSSEDYTTKCKFCHRNYHIKGKTPQFSDFLAFIGNYSAHLRKSHGFLPDCVLSAPCPVYGCSFESLFLQKIRTHLKGHGLVYIVEHQLRRGDIDIPRSPSHINFNQFKCFLCEDDSAVYESYLFFINHFLMKHFIVYDDSVNSEYVLECSKCDYELSFAGRVQLPEVWDIISSLLVHLIASHDSPIPDYVDSYACSEEHCEHRSITRMESEKHALMHTSPLTELVEGSMWYEIHYSQYRCFRCPLEVTCFESLGELAQHWLTYHIQAETCSLYLDCSTCDVVFKHQLVEPEFDDRVVLRLVTEYFLHLVKAHNFPPPDYISKFACGQPGCEFSTFVPELYISHEVALHSKFFQVASKETVLFTDNEKVQECVDESIYSRKPHAITFSQYVCIYCNDGVKYQDMTSLNTHLTANHCKFGKVVCGLQKFTMQCLYCTKEITADTRRRYPNLLLGALIIHMVDYHAYKPPEFIDRIKCTQPDCEFVTYTTGHLATHLKHFHGIIDAKMARGKHKTFFVRAPTSKNLTCKLIFKLRQYKCFECNDNMVVHTFHEYAKHWLETHYTLEDNMYYLSCRLCTHQYKLPVRRSAESSGVLVSVTFYFMHLMNKHKLPLPDYVVTYKCEIPGCDYFTYTLYNLESHCKGRHKITLPEMMAHTESQASTSTAELDESLTTNIQDIMPAEMLPEGTYELSFLPAESGGSSDQAVLVASPKIATFTCFTCGKEFPSADARRKHIKEVHDLEKTDLCHLCSEGFRCKSSLNLHLFRAHQIINDGASGYLCTQCDYRVLSEKKLKKHIALVHSKDAEIVDTQQYSTQ